MGVLETPKGEIHSTVKKTVFAKIKERISLLCKTKLNASNMMQAINEYAISLINYYCGIVDIEPEEYARLDLEIRAVLTQHNIYFKPSCMERLYMPRTKLGRGLSNVEDKSEKILLQFNTFLNNKKEICDRKRCIITNEQNSLTQLGLIDGYLRSKYSLKETIDIDILQTAQTKARKEKLMTKSLHSVLFKSTIDENVDIKASSLWLNKGNNSAQSEALYCLLQDRNMFLGRTDICNHCNVATKTVDHLATRCGKLLNMSYAQRHDEVLRSLHLHYAKKYGFKKSAKLRTHKTERCMSNELAIIKTDSFIFTDVKIACNKPDLFIHDLVQNKITLVEVGITSQDRLKTKETEKYRKYDILAKELSSMYKCEVDIIPFVITWDGIVTKYHKKHVGKIGIDNKTRAYIQSTILKKTFESISFDYRRNNTLKGIRREIAVSEACEETVRLVEQYGQEM